MVTLDNLSPSALDTYQAARKAMYLVLARMHDMGMIPDIEKVQDNKALSVNTFMFGEAFIGNYRNLMDTENRDEQFLSLLGGLLKTFNGKRQLSLLERHNNI